MLSVVVNREAFKVLNLDLVLSLAYGVTLHSKGALAVFATLHFLRNLRMVPIG
jgi:hypothetical protein